MTTSHDAAQEVIELLEVPDWKGVFVLGSFARYVTLYSQQVRALNLIYSLHQAKRLGIGTNVAVIGAGAAGLTATIAAARLGARATLLEKLDGPMGLQRNSQERYVHPHIYDWPATAIDSEHARLPILDWSASYADVVARRFRREWENERRRQSDRIDPPHWGVRDVTIDPSHAGSGLTLTWNDDKGPHGGEYHLVLIAMGFGLEAAQWQQTRYWQNDRLDGRDDGVKRICLVSGCGDGGLTDLMRLCIKDFRHHEVLRLFAGHPQSARLGDDLLDQERRYLKEGDAKGISKYYQELDASYVQEILKDRGMLRSDTEVYLNARSWWDVYSSKSSILNRFIVSQLARMGRWNWIAGSIKSVGPDPSRKHVVLFERDGVARPGKPAAKGQLFDTVVVRHGPAPSVKSDLEEIWEASQSLAERWKRMPPQEDPTRRPLPWENLFDRSAPVSAVPAYARPGQFKLVAFDIDGTLLHGDRFKWSWKLVWHYLKFTDDDHRTLMQRYIDVIQKGEDGWHDSYKEWCDESVILFKERGLKQSDFAAITQGLRPVDGLRETLDDLKRAGIKLAIISGGIDQVMNAKLSEYVDYFDYRFVNQFVFDTQGLISAVDATHYDFRGKLTAIREICERERFSTDEAVFVGDGFNDTKLKNHIGRTIGFMASTPEMELNVDVYIDEPDLRLVLPYVVGRAIPPD